jgi:hypothetical protein
LALTPIILGLAGAGEAVVEGAPSQAEDAKSTAAIGILIGIAPGMAPSF